MSIVRFEAENFKRIIAASMTLNGSTVVIGGKNGAGKSSVLDAIEAAFGGKRRAPAEPIRRGAETAYVVVETDTFTVTRRWTAKSTSLEVTAKDGAKYSSPQKMLDELVDSLSFDPLEFTRRDRREQAAILRALVALDFTDADAKRKEAFDERTSFNREAKRLQGAIEKMPALDESAPETEVSVVDLAAEIERRRLVNVANEAKRQKLNNLRADATLCRADIKAAEEQLAEMQAKLQVLNGTGIALKAETENLVDEDLDEITKQILHAETTNATVRANASRLQLEAELSGAIDRSEDRTTYIAEIDQVKADASAKAKYPIEGLAVTDDGVTLDGLPFEQASQAQQLQASVAIGLALNPGFGVLLIRDGSLLDEDSLRMVDEMAEAAEAQLWIERVSTGQEVTVVIEDGTVAEDRTKPAPVSKKTMTDAPAAEATGVLF